MSLEQHQLHRVAPQPWANGGGLTRELWRWPAQGEWALRLSVAEVAQDGPFSALPGVRRWFVVVAGAGVVLALPGGRRVVEPGAEPLAFDGAAAPHCELLDGPSTDLNLMLRTGAGSAGLHRVAPGDEWAHRAPWRLLYCADPATLQVEDTDAARLGAGTLVVSDHAARQRWRVLPHDPLARRAWWAWWQPEATP